MITLTVLGTGYSFPEVDDEDWGQQVTLWATAVTTALAALSPPTPPIASDGVVMMGNGDALGWRNAGNTGDVFLYVGPDDHLYYQDNAGANFDLSNAAALLGPGSVTDNAVARWDVDAQHLKDSNVTLGDDDTITTPGNVDCDVLGANAVATDAVVIGGVDISLLLPPVGAILPFFDFAGQLVPDASKWALCNGQTVTVAGVGSVTLPDLSGCYLLGTGSDAAAGSMTTNAASILRVGNSLHEVNVAHTHNLDHTHTITTTGTATGGAHVHGSSNLAACIAVNDSTGTRNDGVFVKRRTTTEWDASVGDDAGGPTTAGDGYNNGAAVQGNTDSATHTHSLSTSGTSDSPNTAATPSALSATQSIQPRSVAVLYYMRIA